MFEQCNRLRKTRALNFNVCVRLLCTQFFSDESLNLFFVSQSVLQSSPKIGIAQRRVRVIHESIQCVFVLGKTSYCSLFCEAFCEVFASSNEPRYLFGGISLDVSGLGEQ